MTKVLTNAIRSFAGNGVLLLRPYAKEKGNKLVT
jgi:hypothetical protein